MKWQGHCTEQTGESWPGLNLSSFGVLFIGCVVSCLDETCRCCLNLNTQGLNVQSIDNLFTRVTKSYTIKFLFMGLELVKCVIPCQRENQNILIFDIDGKILCVFAPNGPHIVYLIPNIQQHQDIHLI